MCRQLLNNSNCCCAKFGTVGRQAGEEGRQKRGSGGDFVISAGSRISQVDAVFSGARRARGALIPIQYSSQTEFLIRSSRTKLKQ